jgi:riboflavin kinase/FMN adenylyltransferase
LAVGKFESIHRGHRALVQEVICLAKEKGLASAVAAFTPHPYRVLGNGDYKPLFTQRERARLLEQQGVDYLLEYPFNEDLIALPPADFGQIIFQQLQAHTVVVGEGYRFGHNRAGTVQTLQDLAKQYKREVITTDNYGNISTSSIRALLDGESEANAPQLKKATQLLGFPYFAMGTVAHGRKLGHGLGFPTANLYPPADKFLPQYGVYITQTTAKNRLYNGITHVGLRPTVNASETAPAIETHLFGYNEDAYGLEIKVDFLQFLRAEQRFENFDALKAQVNKDIRKAKGYFK